MWDLWWSGDLYEAGFGWVVVLWRADEFGGAETSSVRGLIFVGRSERAVVMSSEAEYTLEKPIEETIIVERQVEPGIARLTLNRPHKHNALWPPEGFQVVAEALTELAESDEVKVIILAGAGPSFCSGDDLNRTPFEAFGGKPGEKLPQSKRVIGIRQTTGLFRTIVELPKPVIVQAHGTLLGAGFQMALCADLVVAAEGPPGQTSTSSPGCR